jgi:RHS repeat-associated protein
VSGRAEGQVNQVVESGVGVEAVTTTFAYDAIGRVTQEQVQTNATMESYTKQYEYDLVGNRTKLTTDSTTTVSTYNGRDQLLTETTGATTISHGYDSNGSLTSKGSDTFAYDVRGRLAGSSVNGVSSSYRYTVDGIRSSVTENGSTVDYLIDGQSPSGYAQVIEERASGLLVAQYVYGVGLDPSAVFRPDQGGGVYLADGHSGVRQILSGAGAVVWSARYDAYGNRVKHNGTFTNPVSYRGERFDATLGNYYLRTRFYDPRSGRFTQVDPFGGNYGDPMQVMRYGYAGREPGGDDGSDGDVCTWFWRRLTWQSEYSND